MNLPEIGQQIEVCALDALEDLSRVVTWLIAQRSELVRKHAHEIESIRNEPRPKGDLEERIARQQKALDVAVSDLEQLRGRPSPAEEKAMRDEISRLRSALVLAQTKVKKNARRRRSRRT